QQSLPISCTTSLIKEKHKPCLNGNLVPTASYPLPQTLHPVNLHAKGGTNGQEAIDVGGRLRRRLRDHGSVPGLADNRPYRACCLPRQEVGRFGGYGHTRF